MAARRIQWQRKNLTGVECNAELSERTLKKILHLSVDAKKYLMSMAERLHLSGRGLTRVLRLSRTIADLAGQENVDTQFIAEALVYRDGGVLQ